MDKKGVGGGRGGVDENNNLTFFPYRGSLAEGFIVFTCSLLIMWVVLVGGM